MQMAEPVDRFTGQVRCRRHDILVLLHFGQFIRHGDGVERRPDYRMIDWIMNPFTHKIHLQVQLPEAFHVLFSCLHVYFFL